MKKERKLFISSQKTLSREQMKKLGGGCTWNSQCPAGSLCNPVVSGGHLSFQCTH